MSRRGRDSPFKDQLGGFLRATLKQLDTVREAVAQKSKQGKIQLDLTLLRRKKKDALARLGATVAELVDDGRISEDDIPELGDALADLQAVEQKIEFEQQRAHAAAGGYVTAQPPDFYSSDFSAAQSRDSTDADNFAGDFANDPRDQFDDDFPEGDPEDDLEAYADEADDLPADVTQKDGPQKPSA